MNFIRKRATSTLFFVLSLSLLVLGFYRNQWNVVREKKFKNFQTDSESLVIARMVESRQHGIFAENGLLGWGDADPLDLNQSDYDHQYQTYLLGQEFQTYSLYKSVSGFQAMFFSALDRISPFSPAINLRNYHALEALLFATALSVFIMWVFREFGWLTAIVVLFTTLISQWITLYGHNLFYFIWTSFLPMGLVAFYFVWEESNSRTSNLFLALLASSAMLFKCMTNGYDFIIPALAMPTVPLVYYALRDRWGWRKSIQRFSVLSAALLSGIVISILILAMQLRVSEGSFASGLSSIIETFGRRSYGNPDQYSWLYAASLESNPWSVLWIYLSRDMAIQLVDLNFLGVIVIYAIFTIVYVVLDKIKHSQLSDRIKAYALIGATWFSILSPVLWFLIFKGQAYDHRHTNYLAWHMPFTLFGYAMCGFVLQSIGRVLLKPRVS